MNLHQPYIRLLFLYRKDPSLNIFRINIYKKNHAIVLHASIDGPDLDTKKT